MSQFTPSSKNAETEIIEKVATKRSLIPLSFAAIMVFFLFSFVDFKCNGTTAESLTGYNLVFGKTLKNPVNSAFTQAAQNPFLQDDSPYDAGTKSAGNGEKAGPNIWAILALAAAVAGVALFRKTRSGEAFLGTAVAAAGFLSLILLRSAIINKVEAQTGGAGGFAVIETDFQFGYWASLLAFAVAGVISFLRLRYQNQISKGNAEPNVNKLNVFISTGDRSKKAEPDK